MYFSGHRQRENRVYCPTMEGTTNHATGHVSPWRQAIDTWWVLLLVLFFVTAALGLPLLWVSRGFTLAGKVFWTIAVSLYTVLVLWLFWLVMVWCYHEIANALP